MRSAASICGTRMLSLGPDKKHRPLRVRCLPVAPLLLPIAANGDPGTSRLKGSCRTQDVRGHPISRARLSERIIRTDRRNLCVNDVLAADASVSPARGRALPRIIPNFYRPEHGALRDAVYGSVFR